MPNELQLIPVIDIGFKILSGLLTLTIAGLALSIAYWQFKTARDNFRLALYQRRYDVYRGLMDLLASVANSDDDSTTALSKFHGATDQKRFLFKPDLVDYLREVSRNVLDRAQLIRRVDSSSPLPEEKRDVEIARLCELEAWFDKQIEEAQNRFKPYLGFYQKL